MVASADSGGSPPSRLCSVRRAPTASLPRSPAARSAALACQAQPLLGEPSRVPGTGAWAPPSQPEQDPHAEEEQGRPAAPQAAIRVDALRRGKKRRASEARLADPRPPPPPLSTTAHRAPRGRRLRSPPPPPPSERDAAAAVPRAAGVKRGRAAAAGGRGRPLAASPVTPEASPAPSRRSLPPHPPPSPASPRCPRHASTAPRPPAARRCPPRRPRLCGLGRFQVRRPQTTGRSPPSPGAPSGPR